MKACHHHDLFKAIHSDNTREEKWEVAVNHYNKNKLW